MNSIYSFLSKVRPLSKSYTSKFLFVAFLGIHIPLIGLIFFLSFNAGALGKMPVFLITLILTLVATATTLFVLRSLLAPMNAAKNALGAYLSRRELPNLPSGFKDEAGVLMKQVQETIQLLDSLQDEKKDLIGFLSKDLRTPLSTIINLGSQLEQEPHMEAALRKKLAAMIAESAQDQVDRFKQMLSLLRSDEIGANFLQLERVLPARLIDPVLHELQPVAARKGISVELACSASDPVTCDAVLFGQVLRNLLSNAIKFSAQGGRVQLHIEEEHGKFRVAVSDQGQGFDSGRADSLFERLNAASTHPASGQPSGLGLYLARKIVRAHNGSIRAESAGPNRGSRFIVELPAA